MQKLEKVDFRNHNSFIFGDIMGLYRDSNEFIPQQKVFDICFNIEISDEIKDFMKLNGQDKTIEAIFKYLNEKKIYGILEYKSFFGGTQFFSFVASTTNQRINGFLGFENTEWKVFG